MAFMDRGDTDLARFNGLPSRQKIFHKSRKMYCQANDFGSCTLVQKTHQLKLVDKTTHISNSNWAKRLTSPILHLLLIGTDPACDIKLSSDKCKAFEAIIYWNLHGIFLKNSQMEAISNTTSKP